MNKHELAVALSARTNITRKLAKFHIDVVMELVTEELMKGEPVLLTGFGRLYPQQRLPRKRKHPVTGDPVDVRGDMTIRFKPCDNLLHFLNSQQLFIQ